MGPLKHLALLAILATAVYAIPDRRGEKSIGIFNIVKFPNDVCQSDTATKLGTCFTAEECATRNGVASGSCADGYGVCCIITISCGGRSSDNCTHLSQAPSATPNTDSTVLDRQCSYTICPASTTVNKIRLDIAMFTIAPPVVAPANGKAIGTETQGFALGSCISDSFSVTGTGGPYPVICGVNDDQHMIVETDGTTCVTATFSFGLANQQRSYEIHVIQYDRLNEMGGPPNCLQFYTGLTGTVRSFNWVNTMSTHLANQFYDVCVRPEAGRCVTCWSPTISGNGANAAVGNAAKMTVGSFGVSNGKSSTDAVAKSGAGQTQCPGNNGDSNDFVLIRNGAKNAAANIGSGNGINADVVAAAEVGSPSVFCGRFLSLPDNNGDGVTNDGTVCTRSTNFRLGVHFDAGEGIGDGTAAQAMPNLITKNEASGKLTAADNALETPLGTQGFSLGFAQMLC